MSVKAVSSFNRLKWDQFVYKEKAACFYHQYYWSKIAKKSLNLTPVLFTVQEKDHLIGILPLFFKKGFGGKRLITLPLGEAGLLGSARIKKLLIKTALKKANNFQAKLEIFSTEKISSIPENFYQSDEYAYYLLKTNKSYKNIFEKKFHKKTRNIIRKAEKNGINVTMATRNDLKIFYKLYLKTMRKLGTIPLPFEVFKLTWQNFSKETKLFKAQYKNKAIGFLWTFIWKRTLWIWANASDNRFLPLGTNYALYSKTIKLACKSGKVSQVNFGGSDYNSPHEFFKLRWGTTKKPVYLITNNYKSITNRWQMQDKFKLLIRKLPLCLFKLSSKLYKLY